MTDDSKTVLSLATERAKLERNFQTERKLMVTELTDLGLPEGKAVEIANDMLYFDWTIFKAQDVLKTYSLDYNDTGAVITLAKLILSRTNDTTPAKS